jgi:hypothetical protein
VYCNFSNRVVLQLQVARKMKPQLVQGVGNSMQTVLEGKQGFGVVHARYTTSGGAVVIDNE